VLKSPTRCLKSSICSGHPGRGATVEQAIIASGLLALRDDIDLAKNKLGIYSRPVSCMTKFTTATGSKSIAR
jgi:putative ubiquitin-RnfH superfamily antitoxin RatB of RatAB toxin-antitoxin module